MIFRLNPNYLRLNANNLRLNECLIGEHQQLPPILTLFTNPIYITVLYINSLNTLTLKLIIMKYSNYLMMWITTTDYNTLVSLGKEK
jgi:hypothetical protein